MIQSVVGLRFSGVLWILSRFRVVAVVGLQQRILIAMADLSRQRNVALLLRPVLLDRAFAGVFVTGVRRFSQAWIFLLSEQMRLPSFPLLVVANKKKSRRCFAGLLARGAVVSVFQRCHRNQRFLFHDDFRQCLGAILKAAVEGFQVQLAVGLRYRGGHGVAQALPDRAPA